MNKKKIIEQEFIIDILTNSILNRTSGDSFQTEISLLTKADLKNVTKKMVGIFLGKQNLMT